MRNDKPRELSRMVALATVITLCSLDFVVAQEVAPLVEKLSSPDGKVRSDAATELRRLLAGDFNARANNHGRLYWEERLNQVKPGMKHEEVLRILPPADKEVVRRAGRRCEYGGLHEGDDIISFHVEHIIPQKHGGQTNRENLSFACQQCNLHKGPNLSGIDPATGQIVELFHPGRDSWNDHFTSVRDYLHRRSPMGRATVQVLAMNDADRIRLRRVLSPG